jgi:hypothetical protein
MASEGAQDLTDRVFLLRDYLQKERIKISEHLWDGFVGSLEKVSLDKDGLVVPETVDGRIRALTNGLRYFRYRDESKSSISFSDIQDKYFQILETNFGHIRKQMIDAGTDANVAGHVMSRDNEFLEHFTKNIEDFVSDIQEFWRAVGDAAVFHIEDVQGLKAVFGGDIFPSYTRNIASSAAIYVDTIVLPCPILHSAPLIKMWKPEKAAYYVVKHAVNALSYRDLALADVWPPIVAVLPDQEALDEHHVDAISSLSRHAAIRHGCALFGNSFTSIEELTEFLEQLVTPDDVVAKLKKPGRLPFDTEWEGTPLDQLARALEENADFYRGFVSKKHAGRAVFYQCIGRMAQASAVELRSNWLRGTPLIDAETSWKFLNWKMEYDAKISAEPEHPSETMHIVRALQGEGSTNLAWLGNVPPDSIIELRKKGLTDEVRSILSKGIPKLIESNPLNFFRTSDQVVENLDRAFRAHQRALLDARDKKLGFYGIDVGSCLAVGGISVASAITADPLLGATAGILGVAGLPNLRDIRTKFKSLKEEEQKLRTSPTGILFKHLT